MPPQQRNKEEGYTEEPNRIEEPRARLGVDQMAPSEEGYTEEPSRIEEPHARFGVDQIDPMEPLIRTSRESFLREFASAKGPPQIILLCMLLAFGFGSTIGVVSTGMILRAVLMPGLSLLLTLH
jgi:hypothetical protein